MIGATHVAIAVSFGIIAGTENPNLALIACGALLPDLDTPRSTVGRIFLPISIPLGRWLGHRGAFHSFWLWGIVILFGFLWDPFRFIGIGGLIHVVSDCMTVSGVRAMSPWSTKLFVVFKRSWRLKTGGSAEFGILLIAGVLAWTGYQIGVTGGIAATLGKLTGSPKIMLEEYRLKGLTKCFVSGKFRWNSGRIEEGEWLIIGSEGSGIAFEVNGKIINSSKDGKFIRARLNPTEKKWATVKLNGWYETQNQCYFLNKQRWYKALSGDIVWGIVIGNQLGLTDTNFLDINKNKS